LLESAPSVIYSFKAHGDFAPTFVSENIKRLLGYCPEKYLESPDFWRERVHPEDLAFVEVGFQGPARFAEARAGGHRRGAGTDPRPAQEVNLYFMVVKPA
jgi:hypothetical protein